MQVNNIQTYDDNNIIFGGNIVDSRALRKFQSGLNASNKAAFDSYINIIKKSKDKNNYIFDYIQVGNRDSGKKFATISIQKRNKTIQHPPLFSEKAENAIKVFKSLAELCKPAK